MAKPELDDAEFSSGLHKKMGHNDTAILYGRNIAVGDEVNVNGTRGKRPTHWVGRVKTDNGDESYDVEKLKVDHEEETKKDKEDAAGGGTEDVSVTVSNATDTSDPGTGSSANTMTVTNPT